MQSTFWPARKLKNLSWQGGSPPPAVGAHGMRHPAGMGSDQFKCRFRAPLFQRRLRPGDSVRFSHGLVRDLAVHDIETADERRLFLAGLR